MDEKYTIEKLLELIPQSAIKQCYISDSPGYNAAWDYHVTPSGRHFIPCCAEVAFPEFVRLYEYFPATNTVEQKFRLNQKITVYPRAIRPSKFHTSMNTLPNGKIIMTTHTTAGAPTHHCWMPEAYYGHLWEGFPGSNVIIYDPETGDVEDLGIPVPRDSIYGARYIPEHNCLFFITYYRGHAYRFNLDDRSLVDYGQCTEFGSYYITEGPDNNLYFSTRSGDLWRYNVKTMQPEYTGVEIPREDFDESRARNVMTYSANGPDGKLYFCTHLGKHFYSYDPRTNELKRLSPTAPKGVRGYSNRWNFVFGMAFDDEGKLWYTADSLVNKAPLRLCRIDITKPNAEPEDFGAIGTPARSAVCVEGLYLKDGVIYLPDANGPYAPGVTAIDIAAVLRDRDKPRELCQDPHVFFEGKNPRFQELWRGEKPFLPEKYPTLDDNIGAVMKEYNDNNPFSFYRDKKHYAAKLWKRFGTEGSQVVALDFDDDGNARAYVEADGGTRVTVRGGEILKAEKATPPEKESAESIEARFANVKLPAHPGRQFLAKATAYGKLADGSFIVGTRDGMVALVKGERVYSLGAACNDGAIHDIAISPDGRLAVGVAGDESSLGVVFTYDEENGLTVGGFTYYASGCDSREKCSVSCEPRCVAFSKDGKRLAIGARDKLGCVYEYELD